MRGPDPDRTAFGQRPLRGKRQLQRLDGPFGVEQLRIGATADAIDKVLRSLRIQETNLASAIGVQPMRSRLGAYKCLSGRDEGARP